MARKPVADVGESPPRLLQGIGVDDFHHVHAQARLKERQRVGDGPARLALVVPADERSRQLEAAGAGRNDESRTAEAHQKITDLGLPGREENSISGIESGDEEVGPARFVGDIFVRRFGNHLRAPLKVPDLRQGGAKLQLRRGGLLDELVKIMPARSARARAPDDDVSRPLPGRNADHRGVEARRQVRNHRQHPGVRGIDPHAGHQSRDCRQTRLPGRTGLGQWGASAQIRLALSGQGLRSSRVIDSAYCAPASRCKAWNAARIRCRWEASWT